MRGDDSLGLVITTSADRRTAEAIGTALLKARLAACVQYETIHSQYVWDGEVCTDAEVRIMIKTLRRHYSAVEKHILDLHSYDCPQIIWLDIDGGNAAYVQWAHTLMTGH